MDDAESLEILEALAKIEDIGDFRLSALMRQLGMDERQPVLFYRALIRECRENEKFTDILMRSLDNNDKVISQLKTTIAQQRQKINDLTARVNTLEGDNQQKMEEQRQLESGIAQLQEKVADYDALKELLQRRKGTKALGTLYRLLERMYSDSLEVDLHMKPPPDLSQLDNIVEKLRDDLLNVLRIPKHTLESENATLREQIQALQDTVTLLSTMLRGGV